MNSLPDNPFQCEHDPVAQYLEKQSQDLRQHADLIAEFEKSYGYRVWRRRFEGEGTAVIVLEMILRGTVFDAILLPVPPHIDDSDESVLLVASPLIDILEAKIALTIYDFFGDIYKKYTRLRPFGKTDLHQQCCATRKVLRKQYADHLVRLEAFFLGSTRGKAPDCDSFYSIKPVFDEAYKEAVRHLGENATDADVAYQMGIERESLVTLRKKHGTPRLTRAGRGRPPKAKM